MGQQRVRVEVAALPSDELLRIDVELRLKNSDADGAPPDPAAHIREKIVRVVEGECDAFGFKIRAQPTPIAGQVGLRHLARLARALHLRPGGRGKIVSRADQKERGKGERAIPAASDDRAHASPTRYTRLSAEIQAKVLLRSAVRGGIDVGWRHAAVVSARGGSTGVRRDRHPQHAGIAGAQMGLRPAHRLYRRAGSLSLCARLPRAAARPACALRWRAVAPDPGLDRAL